MNRLKDPKNHGDALQSNRNSATRSGISLPAVPVLQSKQRQPVDEETSNKLSEHPAVINSEAAITGNADKKSAQNRLTTNTGSVVQRLVVVSLGNDDMVKASTTSKRPSGGAGGGSQGDHMTPFGVLQAQLANAVAEQTLKNAWIALDATYQIYKTLPGWQLTPKWVLDYDDTVLFYLKKKGDISALQETVSLMLAIRNQVGLTSVSNGTTGHGEGTWLGGLQYYERQLQLKNAITITKSDILINMVELFEYDRYNAMTSGDKQKKVLQQHAITIVDAFPLLSQKYGIKPADVLAKM